MTSQAGPCRCRVEQAMTDVELRGLEPNVDPSKPGSMSSRPDLGRCRFVRAQAYVELSGPDPG